jgi:protein ImuA
MPLAKLIFSSTVSSQSRCRKLNALRRAIVAIERKGAALEDAPAQRFGIASIDKVLGGGLAMGALHEVAAAAEPEIAAATGFTLALAARRPRGAVLWVAEDMGLRESGQPYGLGLDEIGLQPERLVTVAATRVRDVLWAMEEALRCKALAAVIGEVREARSLDDVAARRLSLAANAGGALALLMLARPSPHPSPAVTRWVVGAAPSAPDHHGIGPPRIRVDLVRNRLGRLGTWMLEWSCVDQRFHLASTHPEPLAPAVIDRQDQAAVA